MSFCRAIRLIADVSNTRSCKPYFSKLKIMTLHCTHLYETLVRMKMSLDRFKTNSLIYSYSTRKKFDLFVTSHNTKLVKQSFAHSGVLVSLKGVSTQWKNS
jgi:hypothetical protein